MKYLIIFIAMFSTALAAVRFNTNSGQYEILSKSFNINPDGSYAYEYETSNGISASENGVGGQYAKGSAEWTSPEGEHIILQYTADENGYQPSGSHVPQIPPYILKSLEYIRTHPQKIQR